jgi:hypothetical protein
MGFLAHVRENSYSSTLCQKTADSTSKIVLEKQSFPNAVAKFGENSRDFVQGSLEPVLLNL